MHSGLPRERPAPAEANTGRGGFAGLRLASAVAALSALGGLGAVAVGTVIAHVDERASARLAEETAEKVDAARTAMTAFSRAHEAAKAADRAAAQEVRRTARARARALALEATLSGHGDGHEGDHGTAPEVEPGAYLGVVDVAAERVTSSWPVLAAGSTQSPARAAILSAARGTGGARTLEDETGVLAFGPPAADGRVHFARVDDAAWSAVAPQLEAAATGLVDLASGSAPPEPPASALPFLAGGAALAALLGFAWARARLGRPLEATLLRARAFAHGDAQARADERQGGRDARDVARAVNALIETAERLRALGRAAREEDVRALALGVAALGEGDLIHSTPEVGEALEPIRAALERARRALLDRATQIHHIAVEVAESAAGVAPGARKIAQTAGEQREAIRAIGTGAEEATHQVRVTDERLRASVAALQAFSLEERRVTRELQAALRATGRRVLDLRRGVARLEALAATSEAIEEALDLLGQTATADNPPPRGRITTTVGQGRAALDGLERELAGLRDEMGDVAAGLDTIASSVPESSAELEAAVTGSLHECASKLLRTVELAASGIKVLERSAKVMAEGAAQIARGATISSELAPRLGALVAEFRLGVTFEAELMDRLERWKKEADAARAAPDGLSDDSRQMVRQIAEASEAARQRLARLVSVTEAAMEALRG